MTDTPPKLQRYTFDRVVRMILSALVLAGIFALLRYLADVLIPFAAAVILAYLINPLVNVFEERVKRRSVAVGMTLTLLTVIGMAIVAIIIPVMLSQADRFQRDWQMLKDDLAQAQTMPDATAPDASMPDASMPQATGQEQENAAQDPNLPMRFGWQELQNATTELGKIATGDQPRSFHFRNAKQILEGTYAGRALDYLVLYTQSEDFEKRLDEFSEQLSLYIWNAFASLLNIVIGVVGLMIVLLYLVFLLLDYPQYAKAWKSFLPPAYRETIISFAAEFDIAMRRYFRGQALIALAMAVLFCVGFSLIRLPMAIPLGLFVGALNMVPYLQTVGVVPAFFLAGLKALETDATFGTTIILTLLVFGVAQTLQDVIINPKIMGNATGLRPVAILLGVFIWGKILGFLGVLLAIPLTCLGLAYYRRFILKHPLAETQITDSKPQ
ncbi:MAG: AI-2E family transporter [Phycisphaerae bacterium]